MFAPAVPVPVVYPETYVSQWQNKKLFNKLANGSTQSKIPVSRNPPSLVVIYTKDELLGLIDGANSVLGVERVVKIIDTLHDFWNAERGVDIKRALNRIISNYIADFDGLNADQKSMYKQLLLHSGVPGLLLAFTRVKGAGAPVATPADHSGMGSAGAKYGATSNAISELEPNAAYRYAELTDMSIPSVKHSLQKHKIDIDLDLIKLHDIWNGSVDAPAYINLQALLGNPLVDTIRITFPSDRPTRRAFFADTVKCRKIGNFILLFLNYGIPVTQLRMFVDATAGKLPKFFDGFNQVKKIIDPASIGDSAVNQGMSKSSKGDDDDDDDDGESSGIKSEYLFIDDGDGSVQRKYTSEDHLFTIQGDRLGKGSFEVWYDELPGKIFSRNDPACIRLNVEYTPPTGLFEMGGGTPKTFSKEFSILSSGSPVSGPSVATLSGMICIIDSEIAGGGGVSPAEIKKRIISRLKAMDIKRQLDLTEMVIDMIKQGIDLDLIIALLADLKRLGDYNQNRVAKKYEDHMKIMVLMTSGDILSNYDAKRRGLNSAIPHGHVLDISRYFKEFTRDATTIEAHKQALASEDFVKTQTRMLASIDSLKNRLLKMNTSKVNLEKTFKVLTAHYLKFPEVPGKGILYDIASANRIETIKRTQLGLMKLLLNIDKMRTSIIGEAQRTFEESLVVWVQMPPLVSDAESPDQVEVARKDWTDKASEKINELSNFVEKHDEVYDESPVVSSLMNMTTPSIKDPINAKGDPQLTVLDPYSKLVFDLSNYVNIDVVMSDEPLIIDLNHRCTLFSLINYVVNSRLKIAKGVTERNNATIESARVKLLEFQARLRDILIFFTQAYSLNDNTELKLRLDDILKDIASLKDISYEELESGEYDEYQDVISATIGGPPMDEEPNYNMRCRVVRYVCKQIESIRGIRVKIQTLYSGTMGAGVPNPLPLAIEFNTCHVVQGCIPFIDVPFAGGGNTEYIVGGELTPDQTEGINRVLMRISSRAQQAMEVAYAIMYPCRIKRRRYNEINDTILVDKITIELCNVDSRPNLIKILTEQSTYATNYDEISDTLFEIENQLKIPQLLTISDRMENNDAKRTELNVNILDRITAIKTALDALDIEITREEVSLQEDPAIEFITGDHANRGSGKSLRPNPADFISRENPVIPAILLLDPFEAAKPVTFRDGLLKAYVELIVDLVNETNNLELASTDMPDELKLIFYIVHKINPDLTAIIRTSDYSSVSDPISDDTFEIKMDKGMKAIFDGMNRNKDSIVASISLLDNYKRKQISVIYMLSLLNSNNQYAYFKDMYSPSMLNGNTVSMSDKINAFYNPRNLIKGYDRLVQLQQKMIRDMRR